MSKTHAVKKMPAKVSHSILVPVISKTLLKGDGTTTNSRGMKSEQFILGDGNNEFALKAKTEVGPADNGRSHVSSSSTWDIEVTDGTLIVVEHDDVQITWKGAKDRPLNIILDEVFAEVGKWYISVTAGVPDTATIGQLLQKITNPYS